VHTVIADFQIFDAGTFALQRFHLQQHLIALFTEALQFIQFRIVTHGNNAAVAYQRRRNVRQGFAQQF